MKISVANAVLATLLSTSSVSADAKINDLFERSPNMMDWGAHMLEHNLSFALGNPQQPHPPFDIRVRYLPARDVILIRASIETTSKSDSLAACNNFFWAIRASAGIHPQDGKLLNGLPHTHFSEHFNSSEGDNLDGSEKVKLGAELDKMFQVKADIYEKNSSIYRCTGDLFSSTHNMAE